MNKMGKKKVYALLWWLVQQQYYLPWSSGSSLLITANISSGVFMAVEFYYVGISCLFSLSLLLSFVPLFLVDLSLDDDRSQLFPAMEEPFFLWISFDQKRFWWDSFECRGSASKISLWFVQPKGSKLFPTNFYGWIRHPRLSLNVGHRVSLWNFFIFYLFSFAERKHNVSFL